MEQDILGLCRCAPPRRIQRPLRQTLSSPKIPTRQSQRSQTPERQTEFAWPKKAPQTKSLQKRAFSLRQMCRAQFLFAQQIPGERFDRQEVPCPRRFDTCREEPARLAVIEQRMDAPHLHQQRSFEVSRARLHQPRFAQPFLRRPRGRRNIPHLQIQTRQVDVDAAQIRMIFESGSQCPRLQEGSQRRLILQRKHLAAARTHQETRRCQPVAPAHGLLIALLIQILSRAKVSGLAQAQRVLLDLQGGLIPPRARVRQSRRDDRRGA